MKIDDGLIERIRNFKGLGTTLESAVGAYVVGSVYGWRVVFMMHNQKTVAKYNRILGFKIQDVCPEYTEFSDRFFAIRVAKRAKAFWKVAKSGFAGKGMIDQRTG